MKVENYRFLDYIFPILSHFFPLKSATHYSASGFTELKREGGGGGMANYALNPMKRKTADNDVELKRKEKIIKTFALINNITFLCKAMAKTECRGRKSKE
ncbi:hypothetical protein CEXT_523851 [Caerostris extrusa]|uniref:Uncharacterized protein n=1 Tax=Caerostris extrusa TaxID=172846 RepID=A0AAV4XMU9_CAEEX|nr:hypothetical protein CEXT_523851 [Caerostris extrusa]